MDYYLEKWQRAHQKKSDMVKIKKKKLAVSIKKIYCEIIGEEKDVSLR